MMTTLLVRYRSALYGFLLIVVLSSLSYAIAGLPWIRHLSLSPMIVGIVVGLIYANTLKFKVPASWREGIVFCSKKVLRVGIVFYGFRLTFQNVMAVGWNAMLIDVIVVIGTLLIGVGIGRLLKMDRETALMTSIGSSICGAAAVLGAESVVKCAPYKTAIAVSTVVLFGTLSMFLYPLCYRMGLYDLEPMQMAVYSGATLHEVAHVVGAGEAMGASIAESAVIVKMIRVMMLAPVLLVLGFLFKQDVSQAEQTKTSTTRPKVAIPWFAFGFLGIIIFNSLVTLPSNAIAGINTLDTLMLTMAMTALGSETSVEQFKKAGGYPFLLAGLLYVWLLFGGYFLALYLL